VSQPRVLEPEFRVARSEGDLASHFALRHEVFVREQGIFDGTDRDERDDSSGTVHLVASLGVDVVGAVRLYPLDLAGRTWLGDRLAVAAGSRALQLGAPLVHLAVATAASKGGQIMYAHIQLPNVRFFRHLGWRLDGAVETYAGIDHQPMAIDLPDVARDTK